MNNTTDDTTIQRYLDGDMPTEEKAGFEQLLKTNAKLRQEVDEYRKLQDALFFRKRRSVWDKVQALETQAELEKGPTIAPTNRQNWRPWAIAASVTLLLVAVLVIRNENDTSPEVLFAQNFTPYYLGDDVPKRSDDTVDNLEERAFNAYFSKNYEEAIRLFQEVIAQDDKANYWLYLGNAYLAAQQFAEATDAFQRTLSFSTVLDNEARWYLGLSYLGGGQYEEAAGVFEEIAASDAPYHEEAQHIFDGLKKK